jgi:hypothetical protein
MNRRAMSLKRLLTQAIIRLILVIILGYIFILSIGIFFGNALNWSWLPNYTPDDTIIIVLLALFYVAQFASLIHRYSTRMLPTVMPSYAASPPITPESPKTNAPVEETAVATPPEPNGEQKFAFCPNCGKHLTIAKTFCPFCGFNLATGASTPSPQMTSSPQMSSATPQPPTQTPQPAATLNIYPTKPPRLLSHGGVQWCILIMMKNHGINAKPQRFSDSIKFKEDRFTLLTSNIPSEITAAAKRWDESAVFNWLAPYIPKSLAKVGIQSSPASSPKMNPTQSVSTPIQQISGSAARPTAQVFQTGANLKVNPTPPPRLLSHSPAINCIVIMLAHHKIETKYRIGSKGFYNVKIVDDDFKLEADSIPPEIGEATKSWNETTVINWIAPYIPRSIEKAKLNPQSGIT